MVNIRKKVLYNYYKKTRSLAKPQSCAVIFMRIGKDRDDFEHGFIYYGIVLIIYAILITVGMYIGSKAIKVAIKDRDKIEQINQIEEQVELESQTTVSD